MEQSRRYPVDWVYHMRQGLQAMRRARAEDVDKGGIYDARSAAINIWSDVWDSLAQQAVSEIVGTIYVAWHTPDARHCRVYLLEVEPGWQREDVERHVERLFGRERNQSPGDRAR